MLNVSLPKKQLPQFKQSGLKLVKRHRAPRNKIISKTPLSKHIETKTLMRQQNFVVHNI